jgi:glycosyltransferase involved in cell wall biosynthesis
MKIVIVMTYYDREYQLLKSLASIDHTGAEDVEVIIVDDCSPVRLDTSKICAKVKVSSIRIIDKSWSNPDVAANHGILAALEDGADIIILQNAECYQVGDIIKHAATITDKYYFTYSCFSLSKEETFRDHNIQDLIAKNNHRANGNGELAWYNHPVYRPVNYEFCAAITARNMIDINGYDERLAFGWGYGDNYLLHRIKNKGLQVKCIDTPFVVHQWHYSASSEHTADLVERNRTIYNSLRKSNTVQAQHLFTDNFYHLKTI